MEKRILLSFSIRKTFGWWLCKAEVRVKKVNHFNGIQCSNFKSRYLIAAGATYLNSSKTTKYNQGQIISEIKNQNERKRNI
jgi:hypothetical protein